MNTNLSGITLPLYPRKSYIKDICFGWQCINNCSFPDSSSDSNLKSWSNLFILFHEIFVATKLQWIFNYLNLLISNPIQLLVNCNPVAKKVIIGQFCRIPVCSSQKIKTYMQKLSPTLALNVGIGCKTWMYFLGILGCKLSSDSYLCDSSLFYAQSCI